MIRWITDSLGTAAYDQVCEMDGITIVDVRSLVDKPGNVTDAIASKIKEGVTSLKSGNKTVVCCDYGISRSNSVAVGVLSQFLGIGFLEALTRVQKETGETEIKLEVLNVVQRVVGSVKQPTAREKTYLLTGGSGFIGRELGSALSQKANVVAPSSKDVDVTAGSTVLGMWAKEYSADAIVHLANPRVYTSNKALGTTLTMLQNAIDVCLAENIPLVYLSGWVVYSNYAGNLIADENLPLNPQGPYGMGKMLAENMIRHMQRTAGLKCVLFRPGVVYGPGGNKPKFIYNFIDAIKRKEDIVTHRYQTGSPKLDLLYIDDLVSAIQIVLDSSYVGEIHIGSGELVSTETIARKINQLMGGKSRVTSTEIATPVASVLMDSTLLRSKFNWKPSVTIDEGLNRIIKGE